MKQLKIAAFAAILIPVMFALHINSSKSISSSLKKTEAVAEDAVVDTLITTKIKALFLQEPELSATKIHVKTEDQIVVLTGEVDTEFEEKVALNLAESVKEVRAVRSELHVWLT